MRRSLVYALCWSPRSVGEALRRPHLLHTRAAEALASNADPRGLPNATLLPPTGGNVNGGAAAAAAGMRVSPALSKGLDNFEDSQLGRIAGHVKSYVDEVSRHLMTTVPKAIVHCQVQAARKALLEDMHKEVAMRETDQVTCLPAPFARLSWCKEAAHSDQLFVRGPGHGWLFPGRVLMKQSRGGNRRVCSRQFGTASSHRAEMPCSQGLPHAARGMRLAAPVDNPCGSNPLMQWCAHKQLGA